MRDVLKLTPREEQVLVMIANEMNSHEIAEKLYVSHHTIISHRRKLLAKLEVRNVAGMIRKSFEKGLLTA